MWIEFQIAGSSQWNKTKQKHQATQNTKARLVFCLGPVEMPRFLWAEPTK